MFGAVVLAIALHSPLEVTEPNSGETAKSNRYTYRLPIEAVDAIDIEYRNKGVSATEAYERLRKMIAEHKK